MTRRNKKLKPIDRAVAAVLADDYNDDDNFELKSKSKAHRNIRVNPKETFGGNVLRPRWAIGNTERKELHLIILFCHILMIL